MYIIYIYGHEYNFSSCKTLTEMIDIKNKRQKTKLCSNDTKVTGMLEQYTYHCLGVCVWQNISKFWYVCRFSSERVATKRKGRYFTRVTIRTYIPHQICWNMFLCHIGRHTKYISWDLIPLSLIYVFHSTYPSETKMMLQRKRNFNSKI
jgi:hypothetical protein